MLQRDRQIRTQVHQLADASLFAVSFWLAYCPAQQSDVHRLAAAGRHSPGMDFVRQSDLGFILRSCRRRRWCWSRRAFTAGRR